MEATGVASDVFPDVERVIYKKAPIIEVVCQVRFPADLRIEKEPPAEFQQYVRSMYPLVSEREQALMPGLPPEVARAIGAMGPPTGTNRTWVFGTEDDCKRVELMKDKLTLIAYPYDRWERFSEAFKKPLEALTQVYEPLFFMRIGLRYKNVVRRSQLEGGEMPWSQLLKSHVLGELAIDDVCERVEEVGRRLVLRLPEKQAKATLQHGFVHVENSNEVCYLIDGDFFVERTEVNDARESLEYLHDHARRYFRWCISDTLHQAMEPEPIDVA